MALNLPRAGAVYIPQVPNEIKSTNKELYNYLNAMRLAVERAFAGEFENSLYIAGALNTGTTGSVVVTSGATMSIANGLILTVTS